MSSNFLFRFTVQLSVLGIVQAVFLALVVLFFSRGKKSNGPFLASFLLTLGLVMMFPILQKNLDSQWPYLWCVCDALVFLLGPFLFLYLRGIWVKTTFRDLWPHSLAFVIYALSLYLFLRFGSDPAAANPSWVPCLLFLAAKIGHLGYYVKLGLALVRDQSKIAEGCFSDFNKISTLWAQQLLYGLGAIVFAALVLYLAALFKGGWGDEVDFIVIALFTPYIYLVSFRGLTMPALITPFFEDRKPNRGEKQIHDPDADLVLCDLKRLMDEEKLFLDSQLRIRDLAEKVSCSVHSLSGILNGRLGKNFYEYVNRYRVDEALKKLSNPNLKHQSVLNIALDSGFNSKTAFNTVLKKITGQTPSVYRRRANS